MTDVARVVLALDAPEVAEEVLHFLDRSGFARVVGTAHETGQLAEAARQLEPDAVVASPGLAARARASGGAVIALDTRERVSGLRAAVAAGAAGYVVWPGERDALVGAVAALVRRPAALGRRARVIGVHGSRGGVGVTFVATHLAAAFARRDLATVLIDADPLGDDVAAALGVQADDAGRTLADLRGLEAELTPEQLDRALTPHQAGFRALLAPPSEVADEDWRSVLEAAVNVASATGDVVVVHLPRAHANRFDVGRVLEILELDVWSFRAAARFLDGRRARGPAGEVGLVVNRATRSELVPADVVRAFGVEPLAVLPADRRVPRVMDRGRLLPSRSGPARGIDKLAARLLEAESSDGSEALGAPVADGAEVANVAEVVT